MRLRGTLDIDALRRALDEVVRRHEILRTRYTTVDGTAVATVFDPGPCGLMVEDLGDVPEAQRDGEVQAHAKAEARQSFALDRDLMLRARLLRLANHHHVLLVTLHHIAADGWSLEVLVREVIALYAAGVRNQPFPLAEPAFQYGDFARWQRDSAALWDEENGLLGGASGEPPHRYSCPQRAPRPHLVPHRGAEHAFAIASEVAGALRKLARRCDATPFMVVLAAFKLVLANYSGQNDICVGVTHRKSDAARARAARRLFREHAGVAR